MLGLLVDYVLLHLPSFKVACASFVCVDDLGKLQLSQLLWLDE
jgi:hypothetical protein